jgi:Tol biopolymer transport system component
MCLAADALWLPLPRYLGSYSSSGAGADTFLSSVQLIKKGIGMGRTALLLISTALAVFLISGALFVSSGERARAALPGKNGKIVFQRGGADGGIYTMNPDGSGVKRIADNMNDPDLSPDGKKIVFVGGGKCDGVCVKNLATGRVSLVSDRYIYERIHDSQSETASLSEPAWSPDGKKIAFSVSQVLFPEEYDAYLVERIYVVNADGSGRRELTPSWDHDADGAKWSPDGTKVIYAQGYEGTFDIWSVNADGTGWKTVTEYWQEPEEHAPDWAPSGKKIVFVAESYTTQDGYSYYGVYDLYTMDADGSNRRQLTNTSEDEQEPIWAPAGGKILFERNGDLFTISSADGTGAINITNTPEVSEHPINWQRKP